MGPAVSEKRSAKAWSEGGTLCSVRDCLEISRSVLVPPQGIVLGLGEKSSAEGVERGRGLGLEECNAMAGDDM